MMLRGYRRTDVALLTGGWLPGELLGLPPVARPALGPAATMPAPTDHTSEVCVLDGAGVVRFAELDWIHRRARLEIGLQAATGELTVLLKEVLAHGFEVLNLHRLYGWVTPESGIDTGLLAGAGFEREAVLPDSGWLAGRSVTRELWAAVHHG